MLDKPTWGLFKLIGNNGVKKLVQLNPPIPPLLSLKEYGGSHIL